MALHVLMLAAAVSLCLRASQAFVTGPQPSANAIPTTGLRQAHTSVAAQLAALPRPASTVHASGAGAFMFGLGSLALFSAAALRPAKAQKFGKSGKIVMAASARQVDAMIHSRPWILPEIGPVAPGECLMMSEMQLSQPVAEASQATSAPEPSCQPQSFGCSTGRRAGRARLVGGMRCASKTRTGSRRAFAARRAARRSCGARLQIQLPQEAAEMSSFDPSRVRLKIQTGLATSSSVRSEHGRESRTPVANKGTCISSDARIQEKDLGEHLRRTKLIKSAPLMQAVRGRSSSTSVQQQVRKPA